MFSDLLDDEEDATPKPKPTAAASSPVAAEAVPAAAELSVVPVEAEKPPKKVAAPTPNVQVTVVEDETYDEDEAEDEEARKPTPKPVKSNKVNANQLLPLLTIQNTPALLELQAQLIGNTKNKGILTEPPKPKKKKKVKGSVKKQAAILSNEIGDGDMEKTVAITESPMYEIKVKKTDKKPEVIVEGPIMEKIKLVTKPVNNKKSSKPLSKEPLMTKQESEELFEDDDEEATTLSS